MGGYDAVGVGKRLHDLREHKGFSLGRLAHALRPHYRISGQALSQIERGKRSGSNPDLFDALSVVYRWPSSDLMLSSTDLDPPVQGSPTAAEIAELRSAVDELTRWKAQQEALTLASDSEAVGQVRQRATRPKRELPLYRYLAAGDPDDAENLPPQVDDFEPPSAEVSDRIGPDGYGVIVDGASLEGEGIHDGDVVWIRRVKDGEYQLGDIVAAVVKNGDGINKLVVKQFWHAKGMQGLFSVRDGGIREPTSWHEFRVIGIVEASHPWFELKLAQRQRRRMTA